MINRSIRSAKKMAWEAAYYARYKINSQLQSLLRSPDSGNAVVYLVYAGLANRLRAHVIAEGIARELQRHVHPIWIATSHLNSDAHEVLCCKSVSAGRERRTSIERISPRDVARGLHRKKREQYLGKLLVLDFSAQWVPISEGLRLSSLETIDIEVRDAVHEQARFHMSEMDGGYLAVHVRQTDFITHTDYSQPLPFFEAAIGQALDQANGAEFRNLVVCSDDNVTLSQAVLERFDRVKVITPKYRRTEPGVAAEAFAHLMVLGGGSGLIQSPHSSFSEVAHAMQMGQIRIR